MASAALSLSNDGFMPHGMCYLWRSDILTLHVISDSLISLAYFSISFALLYFVRKRKDLELNWMLVCFAVFIIACGATHMMEIWVIWDPVYWLSGLIKSATALASVATAILLVRLIPNALRFESLSALRSAYADLQGEIAQRRIAEDELRRAYEVLRLDTSRGRLASIVESSDDAIISKTTSGIITSWNRGAERVFGYTDAEAIGKPISLLLPAGYVGEETGILARTARGERVETFETMRVRKDGTQIHVSVTVSPITDGTGKIVGASKIARDISERRKAEETLREQAKILDLAQVISRDRRGRILLWTAGSEKLYGYARGEALTHVSHELLETRFPRPLAEIEKEVERSGIWEGELTHRRRDGTQITVASVWVLHRDAQGNASSILESNTDVTQQKAMERKLAAQLSRMHLLNDITRAIGERQDMASIFQVVVRTVEVQLPVDFVCICLYDSTDSRLTVSAIGGNSYALAVELALTEQSRIEVDPNGLSRCVAGQLIYDPDLAAVPFPFPQRLALRGLRAMVTAPLLVESNVFGILIAARHEPHSFSSGECEFLRQLCEHVALAAHQTQLYSALQIAYEELRQTQQAVMRHEKLRVLGQMASGIAHDINNSLSPAALYLESLLEHDLKLGPDAREYLVIIQRAIEGVAQTVGRMKEFYSQRDSQGGQAPVSLNKVIEQVIDLTRARWRTMPQESGVVINVETALAPELPMVAGDESGIRDALTNLILNAVDAMPKGGRLSLSSAFDSPSHVRVEVSDTGEGMDEHTRSRCLELFFTTKGARGSGLGLAMVYGMIERHGGELQIDSEVGRGTTIRLLFPVMITRVPDNTGSFAILPSESLRILVVDDDPIILKSMFTTLEKDGHVVFAADGGKAGIAEFRSAHERGAPYDVVITDLGMPHVDGRMVAATVKALMPVVPVILLTGWGMRLLAESQVPAHVDRVLSKPPKLATLRAALSEVTMRVES
jgi:PAS domain S-box-containing protein